MAIGVNDSYSTVSGGSIYAGLFAPALIPAYIESMTVGTWDYINPSSTLIALDPEDDPAVNPNYPSNAPWHGNTGQTSIIVAWCGGVWDTTNQRLIICGGGHTDYAGNETYAWNGDTGTFELVTLPTGAIGNTGTLNDGLESSGVYFDGQPRSFHTYNHFAVRNGVVWMFGGSVYITGGSVSRPFYFNGTSWVMAHDVSPGASFGGVCYDSTRDIFWIKKSGTNQPLKYDPNTGAVTTHTKYINGSNYSALFYNSQRDIVISFQDGIHVLLPDDGLDSAQPPTTGTPIGAALGALGSCYDSINDRYLFWNGGTDIYTLTPPTVGSNYKTDTWTWGTITIDGSNVVTPTAAATNGTYGRFWYSEQYKACGVVNATNQGMYVFKLGA